MAWIALCCKIPNYISIIQPIHVRAYQLSWQQQRGSILHNEAIPT